jgi:hypothetical protein
MKPTASLLGLVLFGHTLIALAADTAPAVVPPKPVVLQPTVALPTAPTVSEDSAASAARKEKVGKAGKATKLAKKSEPAKASAKHKAKRAHG